MKKIKCLLSSLLATCLLLSALPVTASAVDKAAVRAKMMEILYNGRRATFTCDFDGYESYSGKHEGIDFQASTQAGTPLYALVSGVVTNVSNSGCSILAVYDVAHDKTVVYLHGIYEVTTGATITQGQRIGTENKLGADAVHAHVEVRNGRRTDAAKSLNDPNLDNPNPYPYWEQVMLNVPPGPERVLDSPSNGENVGGDSFRIIGWVKGRDVEKVTYNINGKGEHAMGTYWREQEQATGYHVDLPSYDWLDWNVNTITVMAYLKDGRSYTVDTVTVYRYADFALDDPKNGMKTDGATLLLQGWVRNEYADWDIDHVSVSVNGGAETRPGLYVREDMPTAIAFRTEINTASALKIGKNTLEVFVHYKNGVRSSACVREVTYQPFTLDEPKNGCNVSGDVFRIIGWVKRADLEKVTFSINGGTEQQLGTYRRDDVNATGFLADLRAYEWLDFNRNTVKVTAYLKGGGKIDLGTREVYRYADFAIDTPQPWSTVSADKFDIDGWFYNEYQGKKIEGVSAVFNGEKTVGLTMYTRPSRPDLQAFRGTFDTLSCLKKGDNTIEIIVRYAGGETASAQKWTVKSTVEPHRHSYSAAVTAPTCTKQGYTTYTCKCGERYQDTYVKARGHSWDEGTMTKAPTETAEGERSYTCTACGEKKTEKIPVLPHKHSYSAAVTAPTCTKQGYTTYTCICGETYKDAYVDAAGHTYDSDRDDTCSACGEKREVDNAVMGDLTGDGLVTSADSVLLAKSLVGLNTLSAAQEALADVSGDGIVSSADAVMVARFLVGLVESL